MICNDFVAEIIRTARADPDLASRSDLLAHFMSTAARDYVMAAGFTSSRRVSRCCLKRVHIFSRHR